MSSPQGTQVSVNSVMEIQKQTIARLMEENIVLQAALLDKEMQIKQLKSEE